MTVSTALAILKLLLSLAAYFAQRAKQTEIETALLAQLENLHGKRVDKAVAARDSVLAGELQPDPDDPNRRD
ncbi:hypothetical protein [Neorhizobium sp. LjRoot104]|uniref:hypothetical protein n=1 Tax=Neorhizobium sp. LjRoot104 TaxID=3342254 RepID=UPI003ECFC138